MVFIGSSIKVDLETYMKKKTTQYFQKYGINKRCAKQKKFNLDTRPVILRLTEPIVS